MIDFNHVKKALRKFSAELEANQNSIKEAFKSGELTEEQKKEAEEITAKMSSITSMDDAFILIDQLNKLQEKWRAK